MRERFKKEKIKPNPDRTFQILHSPLRLAANSLSVEYNYKFPVQAVRANQY